MGIGGKTFSDVCLRAQMLLDRVSHSTLFAGTNQKLHKARFAHPHELEALMAGPRPELGTHLLIGVGPHNQVLSVRPTPLWPELGNIVVIAPPRHGKGLHAKAQLLTWKHSVIVNDMKGEHFAATAGFRQKYIGPVFAIDTRGLGHRFDPLGSCRSEDDFLAMADYLLEKPGDRQGDAFIKRARNMLTALFQAGFYEGWPLLPYCAHLIHIGPEAAATRLATLSRQLGLPEDKNLATRFLDRRFEHVDFQDRYLQNSWSNFSAIMLPIITETVIRSVSGSDFTVEDILLGKTVEENGATVRKPISIYFRFPENRLKALAPLIRLLWSSLTNGLTDLHDARQGQGCNPVLLLLDEAGVAPVPGLPELASSVPGRGISIWADFQDLNQPKSVYGPDRARTLMNSMETQIYSRQSGLETSEYVERRLGRKSEYSHSTSSHEDHQTSESQTEQAVSVLTPQEISELSKTDILCVHRDLKPFRAKRMDWRNYPQLVRQTKIPPPQLQTIPALPPLPPVKTGKPFTPDFVDIDEMTRKKAPPVMKRGQYTERSPQPDPVRGEV